MDEFFMSIRQQPLIKDKNFHNKKTQEINFYKENKTIEYDTQILLCSSTYTLIINYNYSNLIYIECSYNNLTELNALPDNLLYLDCSHNIITELNKLPLKLKYLICNFNNIINFNDLPKSLRELSCSNNKCIKLNNLPDKLKYLKCNENINLTELNTLPDNLLYLDCSYTNITNLDYLPSSLIILYCIGNKSLKHLNKLPKSLKSLRTDSSNLFNLPLYLKQLELYEDAQYNTIINVSPFLNEISLIYNSLKTIDNLPSKLDYLFINNSEYTKTIILPELLSKFICHTEINNERFSVRYHYKERDKFKSIDDNDNMINPYEHMINLFHNTHIYYLPKTLNTLVFKGYELNKIEINILKIKLNNYFNSSIISRIFNNINISFLETKYKLFKSKIIRKKIYI